MKVYARTEGGFVMEIVTPGVHQSELPGWQEGDPSRIGTQMPIEYQFGAEFASWCVEITGMDPQPQPYWTWDGTVFAAPFTPPPDAAQLAATARLQRSELFKTIYDPGIMMALRALRMASTPEATGYAQGKVEELDAYAEALLAIPNQEGFPQTVIWPVAPIK